MGKKKTNFPGETVYYEQEMKFDTKLERLVVWLRLQSRNCQFKIMLKNFVKFC